MQLNNFNMKSKTTNLLFLITFALIVCSCSGNRASNMEINLDTAHITEHKMSEYFEKIEYIPLQTTDESVFGKAKEVYLTDDNIIVLSKNMCLLFDRHNGNFVRKIGTIGRGPEDYKYMIGGDVINEDQNTILAAKDRTTMVYSLSDEKQLAQIHNIDIPSVMISKFIHVKDDMWAVGYYNTMGKNANQVLFFDNNGVVDSIKTTIPFTLESAIEDINPHILDFYKFNNDAYYKFAYSDTIYNITNKKLEPAWVLKTKHSASLVADLRATPKDLWAVMDNYHFVHNIKETNDYLFFNSFFEGKKRLCIYSKQDNTLKVSEKSSFINDIDGGLPFSSTISAANDRLVTLVEPVELKEMVEKNNETTPEAKKLKELLSKVRDEDNNILIIATIKK